MRILIVGGTGFVGPPLVQELLENGHDVTIFHRGKTLDDRTRQASTIVGDRENLASYVDDFKRQEPDVVVDMFPFTADDGRILMETFNGVTQRIVALSSGDVYLAFGRLYRTELGPLKPIPLLENSPLRKTDQPEGPTADKISVEKYVMGSSEISGTVLRLPAIYGPKDDQHRFRAYIKRMDDARPAIIIQEDFYKWRFSQAYVDNVAHAVALAVESERAAGQIYNVADLNTPTMGERAANIAEALGWEGRILPFAKDECPQHLRRDLNFTQQWVMDSTKIRSELGYQEIFPDSEALRRTIDWQRSNPPKAELERFDYDAEDAALSKM